ncbi:MAG TPA: ADOP family duplicated permease [Longimicrobiales bacterium]|nr:ADOP family duplicated permease [Longimicrobiales bacterium]
MTMIAFRAFRSLARARGFAFAVIGTLALGIGAFGTAFTLVDAALWRTPPLPAAERIALLYRTRARGSEPVQRERWSYAALTMLRELTRSSLILANYSLSTLSLTGTGNPESLTGEVVSPEYFTVLGARPRVGRTFLESEDAARATPVIVLSHDLWQRRFAGDREVLGRITHLNGVALTIVGVMPRGFRGITEQAQFWVPTTMAPQLSYAEYLTTDQNFISVVARLRAGVEFSQLQSAMALLGARIQAAVPSEDSDSMTVVSATAVPLNDARVSDTTRRSLLLLFAAVGLLYLLACANAMNLLLGRAAARRREAAILAALGGAPARLVRHFLPEGIALVMAGGILGSIMPWLASRWLRVPPELWGPRTMYGHLSAFSEPSFGARTIGFTAALTLLTIVLVAWAAAISAARIDILAGLREGSRGASARVGTLKRPTLRGTIVALEAALAMLLLVGGGLMIDSFMRMRSTDLGIDADRVLTFWVRPSEVRVPVDAAPAFIRRVLREIASVPGVVAASVDGGAPVSGTARSTLYIIGRPAPRPEAAPPVLRHYIGPDHFRVLGVRLIRGRLFTGGDSAGRPRVAIISESAARRFWPNQDPIGQRVWFGGGSSFNAPDSAAEIVGIVGDVVHEPLDLGPNRNEFYTPYAQFTYASRVVMVRTAGDPLQMVNAIRRAVNRVDPDLPLVEVKTLQQLIGGSWSRQRFDAALFGAFAAIALLLATSGIYAVVSYDVSQRTREMGIRMALGAQQSSILRLVVRGGMSFPVVGLGLGLAAALALTRFLQSALYEVQPTDPRVLAVTAAALLAVSLLACLTPARRATRQDPLVALRSD